MYSFARSFERHPAKKGIANCILATMSYTCTIPFLLISIAMLLNLVILLAAPKGFVRAGIQTQVRVPVRSRSLGLEMESFVFRQLKSVKGPKASKESNSLSDKSTKSKSAKSGSNKSSKSSKSPKSKSAKSKSAKSGSDKSSKSSKSPKSGSDKSAKSGSDKSSKSSKSPKSGSDKSAKSAKQLQQQQQQEQTTSVVTKMDRGPDGVKEKDPLVKKDAKPSLFSSTIFQLFVGAILLGTALVAHYCNMKRTNDPNNGHSSSGGAYKQISSTEMTELGSDDLDAEYGQSKSDNNTNESDDNSRGLGTPQSYQRRAQ